MFIWFMMIPCVQIVPLQSSSIIIRIWLYLIYQESLQFWIILFLIKLILIVNLLLQSPERGVNTFKSFSVSLKQILPWSIYIILFHRDSPLLDGLVSNFQMAFWFEQFTLDYFMMVKETIYLEKHFGENTLLLKIDIVKALNNINWHFL